MYIRSFNDEVHTMASDPRDSSHKLDTLDRSEIWERMATLAINAAAIVVIAFVIAIICVGAS
jgi:hypothetical protein